MMAAEAKLVFRKESLLQMTVEAIEEIVGDDFPGDVEQRYSSVVALLEMDDCDVLIVLMNQSLAPHLLKERCELICQLGAATLFNFSRDHV
ncbi:unnamed protein product [Schistocephalus solidus]|uniref:Dynein light chain n=1 Tax=Schistocephalus solidus TaxID=70667 RepID=A0A183TG33_SCHSO|nr:unnamed protein product [Schistocephalus solidus]